MSDTGYGIAVELLRQGEKGDGIWLDWINCRDLLFEIYEGQNDTTTLSELAEMNKSTINRLKNSLKRRDQQVEKMEELIKNYEKRLDELVVEVSNE